jgi:hypothetical protein
MQESVRRIERMQCAHFAKAACTFERNISALH